MVSWKGHVGAQQIGAQRGAMMTGEGAEEEKGSTADLS